jgi:hypothetical protein
MRSHAAAWERCEITSFSPQSVQFLVAAVAVGRSFGQFALAEPGFTRFFRFEAKRLEACVLVRAIAEGLIGGFATGAPPILFSSFKFDSNWLFGGGSRFVHGVLLVFALKPIIEQSGSLQTLILLSLKSP